MNTTTTENHNLCAKHDHGTKEIAHWYINGEKIIFLFAIPFLLRFSAFFFLGATFRFGAAVFITLCFRCPFTQMLNDLFCWSASIVVGAYRMCRPYKMYLCVLLINETRCKRFNNNFCLQLVCCLHNNSQLQFEQLTNYCFAFFRSALLQSNRFFSPLEPLGEAETDSYTCNGMVH